MINDADYILPGVTQYKYVSLPGSIFRFQLPVNDFLKFRLNI